MLGTSLFSYWLHETAACCYFGVDLGKILDQYSLSRLTDGTPYSSSDLLYFTLLLPFYLDIFQVQLPFSLLLFGQKFLKSNSSSLCSSDKIILSPTLILQKYSKTIINSVLAAKSFQSRKNIPKKVPNSFLLRKIPSFAHHFHTLAAGV